jgi:hypothetical protein
LLTCVALPVHSTVYPSGAAFAASAPPMLPPAPGRFSITNGWLRLTRICSRKTRHITSVAWPVPLRHDRLDRLGRVRLRFAERGNDDAENGEKSAWRIAAQRGAPFGRWAGSVVHHAGIGRGTLVPKSSV